MKEIETASNLPNEAVSSYGFIVAVHSTTAAARAERRTARGIDCRTAVYKPESGHVVSVRPLGQPMAPFIEAFEGAGSVEPKPDV
jgi:hypothetical protein